MNDLGPVNRFEFVIVAALRTAQLVRGCTPRVIASNRYTTTAVREVHAGKTAAEPRVAGAPNLPQRMPSRTTR